MSDVSFTDAVAERSGHPPNDVADLLNVARVPTSDVPSEPHKLRVTRLQFRGQKEGKVTGEIDFDHEFGNGLWSISSEKNQRGKSSILEIMMWAIRGQPKRLMPEVRKWLHFVALEGSVDDEDFRLEFDLTTGRPVGSLTCGVEVHPFASDAAFAEAMSEFMMGRLGFHKFTQWASGQGEQVHQWPTYSSVLYLPREYEDTVIGDLSGVGLAQKLVLLFIGMQWSRTHVAALAAYNEAKEASADREAKQETLKNAASGTIEARRKRLGEVNQLLTALPAELPTDKQIGDAKADWLALLGQHGTLSADLREAERDALSTKREATRAKKHLTDLTEAALARRLFHSLNPSKCPRCSVPIDADRKAAEKADHHCAVCDRELDLDLEVEIDNAVIGDDDADEPTTRAELEALVDDLQSAAGQEDQRTEDLRTRVQQLALRIGEAETLVESYQLQAAYVEQRRDLESEKRSLEDQIATLSDLAGEPDQPSLPDTTAQARLEILEEAVAEAKHRVDIGFQAVVDDVNAAITDIAQRFGVELLEEARLNLAAQLRLKQGGINTSFSKTSPGEKLRLRVAVPIALLRVSAQHNVGRHPGLLLIDSLGAEETAAEDLEEFMRELEAVTAELGIETIVASQRSEILTHVPQHHQIAVTGDDYLF